jgi:hypothetical protein
LSDCFALACDLLFLESALFLGDIIASSLNMFYIWPRDHNIFAKYYLNPDLEILQNYPPVLSITQTIISDEEADY